MRPVVLALTCLVALSPALAQELPLADHQLVDVIVEVESGRPVERAELEARLARADFVLLGEKHDNVRHHAIQAELVEALGRQGRLEAVAFEMLPTDRQTALVEHLAAGGTVAAMATALGWADLGWGPWSWYGPIADAGHRHGALLVAANLSDDETARVYREGLAVLDPRLRQRTGLDEELGGDEQAARERAMVAAHCGHELGAAAARMVDVQRARDARMAERLALLAGNGQGVLVTGNAHAATDVGVPVTLRRLRPAADVVSIGLVEVEPDWTEVPTGEWPHDYVWLTPRAHDVDHDYCDGLATRG